MASPIFAIFEPKTLPITKSVYPWNALINPTTNSGNDVPIDTIVKPITKSDTFKALARSFAPFMSHSEPKYKPKDPIIRKNRLENISIVHLC